jgi:hypothetical protein
MRAVFDANKHKVFRALQIGQRTHFVIHAFAIFNGRPLTGFSGLNLELITRWPGRTTDQHHQD